MRGRDKKDVIRVGVIGAGSMGRNHARILSDIPGVRLTAVVDHTLQKAESIATQYGAFATTDYHEIVHMVDAVSIATTTSQHHEVGVFFLSNGKDSLIEKPIATSLQEADDLIREAEAGGAILQVGHLERFNGGVKMLSQMITSPLMIESHRVTPFHGRCIDVDVTLDLMIHDIDIILSLVKSDISDIKATGASVLTGNIDVAHAWIEFNNGCIAEAVASRIAEEKSRVIKVFQHDICLELDYTRQELTSYTRGSGGLRKQTRKALYMEPLREELISFIECIRHRSRPVVSGYEGREALRVALEVSRLVKYATQV